MTALVYMTGKNAPLEFDTVELAESGLMALGFVRRRDQPRQWVRFDPNGNAFASVVDPSTITPG